MKTDTLFPQKYLWAIGGAAAGLALLIHAFWQRNVEAIVIPVVLGIIAVGWMEFSGQWTWKVLLKLSRFAVFAVLTVKTSSIITLNGIRVLVLVAIAMQIVLFGSVFVRQRSQSRFGELATNSLFVKMHLGVMAILVCIMMLQGIRGSMSMDHLRVFVQRLLE